jgi:hypothetical protein
MQRVNCVVAVGGDIGNQIQKIDITVAEVALLQRVHGEGSCKEILPLESSGESLTHREEYDRLKEAYPRYAGEAEKIWMDLGGKLPSDLSDLKLTREMLSRDYVPPKAPEKPSKKAAAPVTEGV